MGGSRSHQQLICSVFFGYTITKDRVTDNWSEGALMNHTVLIDRLETTYQKKHNTINTMDELGLSFSSKEPLNPEHHVKYNKKVNNMYKTKFRNIHSNKRIILTTVSNYRRFV